MTTIRKPRTPSGLVKKGKFVRALMEVIAENGALTVQQLMLNHNRHGELGYSQDYLETNLKKLVASNELVQDDGGRYHLPVVQRAPKPKPIPQEEADAKASYLVERHGNPFQNVDLSYPVDKMVREAVPAKIEGKLPRSNSLEKILALGWYQDFPDIVVAINYYTDTHKAGYQVVKDRLEFVDHE